MFARNALTIIVAMTLATMIQDVSNEASAQRLFSIGGPNGIVAGGGQGLRIGGVNGVQVGGGQGLRFGPPGIGVQYGGGQGVRYGTRNFGVQYGGGQLLRYGTPNAGVKIGGGEGLRLGTRNSGFQMGTGQGLQVGRFNQPTNSTVSPSGITQVTANTRMPTPAPGARTAALKGTSPQPVLAGPGGARPSQTPSQSDIAAQPQSNNTASNFAAGTGSGQIILSYPQTARGDLQYTANGTPFRLRPGQSIHFAKGQKWTIGLRDGKGQVREHDISTPKRYQLTESENGWTIEGSEAASSTPANPTTAAEEAAQPKAEPTGKDETAEASSVLKYK